MNKDLLAIAKAKQNKVSNPHIHAWVSASAGAGKTTVLVQRILRLLLLEGVKPENITAITYTKAGANEMANRIVASLNEWAVMDEQQLVSVLQSVLGEVPNKQQISIARSLFASVLDTKGGLKIQTIHSFCQSLLARFPLESGVPQGFQIIEDNRLYLEKAKQLLIKNKTSLAYIQKYVVFNAQLDELFKSLSDNSNMEKFSNIINGIGIEKAIDNMYNQFNFSPLTTERDLYKECQSKAKSPEIQSALSALKQQAKKHNNDTARKVIADITAYEQTGNIELLQTAFKVHKGLKLYKENTDIISIGEQWKTDYKNKLNTYNLLCTTTTVYEIAQQFINIYAQVKKSHNVLDFGDIIIKTKQLLKTKQIADWVLFKTDYGHKHILLDEAQDTAPLQWSIIHKIIAPFFYGQTMENTLFVVGDEKQSIYSFQGAEQKNFAVQEKYIADVSVKSGQEFQATNFNLSFRSTAPILNWVDNTFAECSDGLSNTVIKHYSNRENQLGKVKLLPALKSLPQNSGLKLSLCYAKIIAEEISQIIGTEYLSSQQRYATAGDIIVLVRSRNDFVNGLIRELRGRDIGVEGADRVILNQQIVVKDLLALLRFSVLPEDDLNLACLLKTPLFGFDDDKLFEIANGRSDKSLWQILKQHKKYANVINYLQTVLNKADFIRPLETISYALNNPCPITDVINTATTINGRQAFVERLGKTANDFINALLIEIVNFEHLNPPTAQGFLNYFDIADTAIKREQDDSQNRVRIMTIHAAKGLESPVVIVPNCLNSIKADSGIIWGKNNNMLMVGKIEQQVIPNVKQYLYDNNENFKTADLYENRRLLYVAMTRAKDMLVCGGYGKKSDKNNDETWYDLLLNGMYKFDNYIEEPFASVAINKDIWQDSKNFYRPCENGVYSYVYSNIDTAKQAEVIPAEIIVDTNLMSVPDWAVKFAKNEREKYAKTAPSQSDDYEPPAPASPLLQIDNYDGLKIGSIMHRCLEMVPNIPEQTRQQAIQNYLSLPQHQLDIEQQNKIVEKILSTINIYPELFAKNSKAEVPVSGVVNINGRERLITGFIDRLCFVGDEVWVVDYKSNRKTPKNQNQVPEVYINQLSIYKQIIAKIYPDITVKTKLLWTYDLNLMDIAIK